MYDIDAWFAAAKPASPFVCKRKCQTWLGELKGNESLVKLSGIGDRSSAYAMQMQ